MELTQRQILALLLKLSADKRISLDARAAACVLGLDVAKAPAVDGFTVDFDEEDAPSAL